MADNTVFDSVFKTMVHKTPQLIVPFINEAFGREYPADTPVIQFSNEHEELRGSLIDDSVFRLQDKIYHVECQSTNDSSMVIRMIEYDFAIALEQALAAGQPYEIDFPSSCVLFLRHSDKTPDVLQLKVNLPNGESFLYETKVVKAQSYDSKELFQKRLFLLLPYYLMRYERSLDRIAADANLTAQLVEECVDLNNQLVNTMLETGDRLLYEELVELIIRVIDHIMAKYESLRGKVRGAMGGEVLELLNERAKRLEREAEERGYRDGIIQGEKQGIEQGIVQGIEQGIDGLVAELTERGVDENLIREAILALKQSREASQLDTRSDGSSSDTGCSPDHI